MFLWRARWRRLRSRRATSARSSSPTSFDWIEHDSRTGDSGNGEALGFGLRLGTEVGRRWGVEVEFVRPGEITSDGLRRFCRRIRGHPRASGADLPNVLPDPVVGPPGFSYRFRANQRRTTLSTALWVRQEISRRFSLAYVGGVAFGRTETELEISYLPIRPTIIPIPPSVNESVNYDVARWSASKGRIRMAGQVDLVPGIRLQGNQVCGAWLIRPLLVRLLGVAFWLVGSSCGLGTWSPV